MVVKYLMYVWGFVFNLSLVNESFIVYRHSWVILFI